ncbi:hypothetical protein PR048_016527 [Dryococelus australis]|uniref:Uncharacterized protein n=1 Tax=Dryococelus australis TaxID=614101 RepID=A0ABQ9HK14_9NEOP|nr:hypothetical protein PR048_016527 [Dryococelus australis]
MTQFLSSLLHLEGVSKSIITSLNMDIHLCQSVPDRSLPPLAWSEKTLQIAMHRSGVRRLCKENYIEVE